MRLFFEEHQYEAEAVQDELKNIIALQDVEKKISIGYVGYFYNADIPDCVFVLPKVLLEDKQIIVDGKQRTIDVIANLKCAVEGKDYVTPEDIITPEGQSLYLTPEYRKFIYEFSVWVYRALSVYRQKKPKSKAVYYRQVPQEGHGRRLKANTFLDIILSLIRFNRENQNFFMFTIKNLHRGHNKINWTKTISHSAAVVQNENPVYLQVVNRRRQINFDEELFVIFFSILNRLNEDYGFRIPINYQYELITGSHFDAYLSGLGCKRLRQIKYKYFSDKALLLWDLCYAFFKSSHQIAVNTNQKEYLLAKSFEYIFEAIIDDLIGDADVPKGLKEQYDGKRVDTFYTYKGLTVSNEQDDEIYYIGDSKYYKTNHKLGHNSIYKQYTYARNVIQWNIDLFMGQNKAWDNTEDFEYDEANFKKVRLRNDVADPLTEGYNVIPNFFISAFALFDEKNNDYRTYKVDGFKPNNGGNHTHISFQFNDRLFDRDTLILSHYDVNFLYVLYLYARNKQSEKTLWKNYVRERFRSEIRDVLKDKFDFYALKAKGNPLAGEQFIKENFKELQGKLYRPYGDRNLYALALEKREGAYTKDSDTYHLLNEYFEIKSVTLGENPKEQLEQQVAQYQIEHPYSLVPKNWLPDYHVERYLDDYFVVGLYHDQEHWDWITGKNDRGSLIYNVRLDINRQGALRKSRIRSMRPKFAILYEDGHEAENKYHVFRIHDYAEMTEERMRLALYPKEPQGDYFIFRFDEEITLGNIDVARLIDDWRKENPDAEVGTPIFMKGEDVIKYRKY